MNPGLHRWQGMTLTSLETPELIEIAMLLDRLYSNRTGGRMMTDRAHQACSRELLFATIATLDKALDRFRPLDQPRLPGPASPTPTASPSSKSASGLPGAEASTEPGATGDLLDGLSTKPSIPKAP